jgi:toxin ParE1/3/4
MVVGAIEDLEAIAQYISADSSAYAATVVKTILNTTRNLSRFPLLVVSFS